MSDQEVVIVAGLGEVGKPLHALLKKVYPCVGVDILPVSVKSSCSVLHICYPYQIRDFIGTTVAYISKYQPKLTIINSTIPPGTTTLIEKASQAKIVYSPVRGKHARMEQELLRYKKFLASSNPTATERAREHFDRAGFKTDVFATPEIAELSKLIETSWLGILVGWAQEVERYSASYGAAYEEVNRFIEEIDFLPSHIFPGVIGGHCVMPNIELLRSKFESQFLEAVVDSNQRKLQSESKKEGEALCQELV